MTKLNKNVTFFISTMLDIYRPEVRAKYGERYSGIYSSEWSRTRIEFFRNWTLKSIQNQTFSDFIILMFCHEKSRSLVESYSWDKNIKFCYDYGESVFKNIKTDFISITRWDTDDLMRKEGMALIADNFSETKRYKRLLFSDYYTWLFDHGVFIHRLNPLTIARGPKWSPGYTLIMSKGANIREKWFVWPPYMCRQPYKVIGSDMICDIKLKESTHDALWHSDASSIQVLRKTVLEAKRRGDEIITSPDRQAKICEDLGIDQEQFKKCVK